MLGTTSWDIRDASGLLDQLLKIFRPVSSQADETISQAKVLWQQDQQSDALDLLFEFIQPQSSKVSEAIPILNELKGVLEKVGCPVDLQDSKILQLELHAKELDQRIIRQDARIEVWRRMPARKLRPKTRDSRGCSLDKQHMPWPRS